MLITCNNKGCLKSSEAKFDEKTGDVLCQECGKTISNIADTMKRAMKSVGQVVRTQERKAFLLACRNCKANREIILDQKNNTLCKICHEPINTTPAFKLAMEEAGMRLDKVEIIPNTPKVTKSKRKYSSKKKVKE